MANKDFTQGLLDRMSIQFTTFRKELRTTKTKLNQDLESLQVTLINLGHTLIGDHLSAKQLYNLSDINEELLKFSAAVEEIKCKLNKFTNSD